MSARCMDCGAVTERKADGTLVIRHADDCPNRRFPSGAAGVGGSMNDDDWNGRCSVMWVGADLEIVQADPRVIISDELVARVQDGYGHPNVSLVDGVFTIRGTNRTAVYRLGEHVPDLAGYRAEWPD